MAINWTIAMRGPAGSGGMTPAEREEMRAEIVDQSRADASAMLDRAIYSASTEAEYQAAISSVPPRHVVVWPQGSKMWVRGAEVPLGGTPPVIPPITGRSTTSVGLNGLSDWSTAYPFIDAFKLARTWLGHLPGQWGAFDFEDFDTDADGWVRGLPEGADVAEALLLVDLPSEMTFAAGTYDVTWEGDGTLTIGSGAQNVTVTGTRSRSFTFTPSRGNNVSIAVSNVTPIAYIRNIRVVKREHAALFAAGEIFNPTWLDVVRGFKGIRFMDWQATNGSPVSTWAQRTRPESVAWLRGGAPLEVMVALANEIEADPWFCIPHLADDNYVQQFAAYVRANLDSRLVASFEYSNEIWNTMFGQTQWLLQRAQTELPGVGDGWMQLGGIRAAQVADIVADAFDGATNFRRVAGAHTGWHGLEAGFLNAADYRAQHPGLPAPSVSFDSYAVTGYFDGEMSQAEMVPTIRQWIADSTPGTFDVAIQNAVANIRSSETGNSMWHIFAHWDYHKGVADTYGYRFLMYEGGTHTIVPDGHWEEFGEFYEALNYSEGMAVNYRDAINQWERIGGDSFNAFVEISLPAIYGFWGALRYLGDDTLKLRVIKGDRLPAIPEEPILPFDPSGPPAPAIDPASVPGYAFTMGPIVADGTPTSLTDLPGPVGAGGIYGVMSFSVTNPQPAEQSVMLYLGSASGQNVVSFNARTNLGAILMESEASGGENVYIVGDGIHGDKIIEFWLLPTGGGMMINGIEDVNAGMRSSADPATRFRIGDAGWGPEPFSGTIYRAAFFTVTDKPSDETRAGLRSWARGTQ